MSEFDREAERERLREKYERDKQKREATEEMSELLLQGATMTNAHCSDCGNPIFRYDGQEFCATCEKAVDRGGEGEDSDGAAGSVEVTEPSDETRVVFGSDAAERSAGGQTETDPAETGPAERPETEQEPPETDPAGRDREPSGPADVESSRGERTAETGDTGVFPPESRPTATGPDGDGNRGEQESGADIREGTPRDDVADARATLARTLARYSRRAEDAGDPREAREYLDVANAAAQTLASLRE